MGLDGNKDGIGHGHASGSHSNPFDANSKIMLAAITSLSAVILLVLALHLYARCALRRRYSRQRSVFRGLISTIGSAAPPSRTGLDPTVIASLPTFVVNKTDGSDHATSAVAECAVCLGCLEDQDRARVLPNCKHVFHVECIDVWLGSHATCPLCRAEASPRTQLEPEPREGPVGPSGGAPPSAPPLERMGGGSTRAEGGSLLETNGGLLQPTANNKVSGSSSRFNSFRRIMSRDRSFRRINTSRGNQDAGVEDLERQ